jgi:hypothetical protein
MKNTLSRKDLSKNSHLLPTSHKGDIGIWFLLSVIVYALYGSVIDLWWTYDDTQILRQAIKYSPSQYFFIPKIWQELSWVNFTPLVTFSFDLDIALFGLNPKMFYLHHLIVLWLCSAMLYTILRFWISRPFALTGASLFLIGIPVAILSQQLMARHYLEGLLLAMISFYLFIKAVRGGKTGLAFWSACLYTGAMSAKEIYVPLVFLLLALPEKNWKVRFKYSIPLLVVFLTYIGWRWWMIGTPIGGYGAQMQIRDIFDILKRIPTTLFCMKSGKDFFIILIIFWPVVVFLIKRRQATLFIIWIAILTLLPTLTIPSFLFDMRHFFMVWTMSSVLLVMVSQQLWNIKPIYYILSISLLALVVIHVFPNNREVWNNNLEVSARMSAEGRFFLLEAKNHDLLRHPSAAPWYFEGLSWLKRYYYGKGENAKYFYDDIYLCEETLDGKRVWEYSSADRRIIDITQLIPEIRKNYCDKIRQDVPLNISINYLQSNLSWEFSPYKEGRYSFILDNGAIKYDFPPSGNLKVTLSGTVIFRVRYESPGGWITYSPHLAFKIVQGSGTINWKRGHNAKD